MKLNMKNAMIRFSALLLAAALGACDGGGEAPAGDGTGDPPPVFSAVDPSKVCPVGYVGWDFATGTNVEDIPKAIKVKAAQCLVGLQSTDVAATVKTACDGKQSCQVAVECMGQVLATWTCGDDLEEMTTTLPIGGGAVQLACALKTGDGGAPAIASPTGKACVPKVCPGNQRRDAKMNCVADVSKKTMSPGIFTELKVTPTHQIYPGDGFAENASYDFTLNGHVGIDANRNRLEGYGDTQGTVWLTDRFARVLPNGTTDDKDFVEGFRCEATKIDLKMPSYFWKNHVVGCCDLRQDREAFSFRHTVRLSKECTDPRVAPNAADNAALRAGLKPTDFDKKYKFVGTYGHVSVDMEGLTLPSATGSGLTVCAVNPPGFYYHPAEAYVDRIGYYQQRELAPERTVVAKIHGKTSGEPTRIEVGIPSATFREPEFVAKVFGDDLPILTADVNWYLAGDNPRNPYSPKADVAGVDNLTRRNLRASMYFYIRRRPSNALTKDPGLVEKVLISSAPMPQNLHSPTGATAPMKFKVPKKIKDLMFNSYNGWAGYDWVQATVCVAAEGLDSTVGATDLPWVRTGADIWSAGMGAQTGCSPGTLLHVVRDYTRRPLAPTAKGPDTAMSKDTGTGDGSSSSGTTTDADRSCTNGVCTTTRQTGLTTGGIVRRMLFDVVTHVVTKDTDQSASVATDATAEAMGFQIVDVDDAEQEKEFADRVNTPADGINIEIAPNWDLVIGKLRKAFGKSPVEWEKGKFAGVMGLGVGLGYKVPLQIGPIPGLVTISVSAGLSVAVAVQVKYRAEPDNAYPCVTGDTSQRCYGVVGGSSPLTQLEAQGKCGAKGGRIAEVHSLDELQHLRAYMNAGAAGDQVWLGAQMAYQYPMPSCGDDFNSQGCAAGTTTTFRWLSDDSVVAKKFGPGQAALEPAAVGVLIANGELKSLAPAMGGVVFDNQTGEIKAARGDTKLAAVCEFDPASAASFLGFSTGVKLGGGAGLGVSFCTPSDDLGICIEGHLNFIDIGITPQFGVSNYLLFRKDSSTGKNKLFGLRGNTYTVAPVEVNLLSGSVDAVVNFFIGSATWTIVEYPGFSLFGTNLFEKNNPFSENY